MTVLTSIQGCAYLQILLQQSAAKCGKPVHRRTRVVLQTSPGIAECER